MILIPEAYMLFEYVRQGVAMATAFANTLWMELLPHADFMLHV